MGGAKAPALLVAQLALASFSAFPGTPAPHVCPRMGGRQILVVGGLRQKMAHETGKQRASKIPLDYFRHSSPLDRWRLWLAIIALAATVGWIGWAVVNGKAA